MNYVSSTKKEIWDAYKAAKDQLEALAKPTENTVEKAKTVQTAKAIESSNSIDIESVETSLTVLVTKIAELKSQYDDIITAITAKKNELKEVHEIEASANDLAALITAKEKLIEMSAKAAEEKKKEADDYYNDKVAAANEFTKLTALNHKREEEEYIYNTTRQRKRDEDAVADALELKKRSLDDREKAVAEREALADENEKKVTDLQKKYEDLEKSVNAEIAAAVQTAKDGTQKSAQIAANILKANTDADMRIATAKIETLEAKVVELQKQLDKANELVAKANTQVSDMAQSALKAQGDVNTISKVSEIAAGSQKKS